MKQRKPWAALMCLLADSLAKTSALQANDAALPDAREADYGLSYYALLATLDRDASCWKTSGTSTMWGEPPSLQRLPTSGMMLSGCLYELPMLAHRTSVNAGSAWPTPTVGDGANRQAPKNVHITSNGTLKVDNEHRSQVRLSEHVKWLESQETHSPDLALNPDWVELLMGYPAGWTDIADNGQPDPANASTPMNHPAPLTERNTG